MEVATEHISQHYPVRQVLSYCGLSASSYYYKPTGNRQGRKPYAKMYDCNRLEVDDTFILEAILKLFENPFVDYGCYKTYIYLTDNKKYIISKHKVYEIMKNNNILRQKGAQSSKRNKVNRVVDLIPNTKGPFSYFEIDIKFMYMYGQRRNAQMLTIIDIETRIVLGQYIDYQIGKRKVIDLFDKIFEKYDLPKNFILRSDNGSQFIANMIQNYLKKKEVIQEFIKPATPQQDAHIESFHSIIERAICQRFEFENVKILVETMKKFMDFYNFERIHSGTNFKSPYVNFLQKEEAKKAPSLVKPIIVVLKQMYKKYMENI